MSDFYRSPEWQRVRREAIRNYPRKCMRCGSRKMLEVAHIKARSKYPKLALKLSNLQILCKRCNLWQGTRTMDFRPESTVTKIMVWLFYGTISAILYWGIYCD